MKLIKVFLFALVIQLCIGITSQPAVAASIQLQVDTLPDELQQVMVMASEGQLKEAEDELKSLRSTFGHTADYYFIKGSLAPFKLAEASVVRAPFIARRMRKDWEKAVEIDPNHELASFSLALFYGAAPGIVGGDTEKAAAILAHLQGLDSPWQYPLKANLAFAQEASLDEVKAAHLEWIEFAPKEISPRFNLATFLINKEDYEAGAMQLAQLDELLQTLRAHAELEAEPEPEPEQNAEQDAEQNTNEEVASNQLKVDYQWGKLAAESGTHLELGKERLQALISNEQLPEGIGIGFVHARLAQVFQHIGEPALVAEHRSAAELLASGDTNLTGLIKKLDG